MNKRIIDFYRDFQNYSYTIERISKIPHRVNNSLSDSLIVAIPYFDIFASWANLLLLIPKHCHIIIFRGGH